MSYALPFSEDQRDCLQEVSNVAMGNAAQHLAGFAKAFVNLPIPVIRYIDSAQITEALVGLQGDENVSAVVQPFNVGRYEGQALLAITEPSFNDLAVATGRAVDNDKVASDLLLELSRVVSSNCLQQLTELLESEFIIHEPEVLSLHVPLEELRFDDLATWDRIVTIEINYHLEGRTFNCDLVLLLPDVLVEELVVILDALI